ncbi:hypothetical protein AALP_AAs51909U000300 [Arabis alpina]|uniref:Glabrous enhancer-binding protein-like C-terminal domain-containing protein n=1 Tax=Arabis alpina TaxID=50452 RepID=A0A087G2I5_ARAAL|nr:hypothetical protein AALP_AAs51909U000300 [Arabis alpina]
MAKKKNTEPLEDPHIQTSSDEEEAENSSGGEEEDNSGSESGSEEDVPKATVITSGNIPVPDTVASAPPVVQSGLKRPRSEETSTLFESDSDDSETEEDKEVVPVTTSVKLKDKEVVDAAASTPMALKYALKRPASEGTSTAVKKVKIVEQSDSKRPRFQRVWTPKDEFLLLKVVGKSSGNGKAKRSRRKKIEEEPEKDVLVPHWFETSLLVQYSASHGLDKEYVIQKWREMSMEDKKIFEEKSKLLRDKEVECAVFKTKYLNEVVPMIFKPS